MARWYIDMRVMLGLAVLVVALSPAAAHADVQFRVLSDQNELRYPTTETLSYGLEMVTGPEPERFAIEVSLPRYRPFEGQSVAIHDVALEGPGLMGMRRRRRGLVSCSTRFPGAVHGYEFSDLAQTVELPSSSTSILRVRLQTGISPPWPNLSYAPTFTATPSLVEGGQGTLTHATRLAAPDPQVTGASGLNITFKTKPETTFPANRRHRHKIRAGRVVAITGKTRPVLARGRLRVAYAGPGKKGLKTVRRTKANGKGRFHLRWKPKRLGYYEIWVLYKSHRPDLVSDFACPRAFHLVD